MTKKETEILLPEDRLWGPKSIQSLVFQQQRIGPLTLVFKRTSNELWIASDRSQKGVIDFEELDWSRWALKKEDTPIELFPLMPDLQVIVRPENTFMLSPGAQVRIFTRIPVWVGIYSNDGKKNKLAEIPTMILSKTWFGDFEDGVLSYWVSTTARREVNKDVYQPHVAISTLNIKNESETDLKIEKLSIRVDKLSLLEKDGQLWTDEMDIRYKGEEQHSEISIKGKLPVELKDAKLISQPRDPIKKSFVERTFRILKEIPGFS